ncbi:MAG: hypothetical protein KGM91_04490 [Burkholderiales bacterium]|nr:hypothetical protein [Burkholderiales bacterium]
MSSYDEDITPGERDDAWHAAEYKRRVELNRARGLGSDLRDSTGSSPQAGGGGMESAGKGAVLLVLMGVPTALVILAMLYGLAALGWPQWLAVVGLANLYPRPGVLGMVAWMSRPAAVILLLCGLFQ